MSFRFWIGSWITLILLILVAIDASALVCYITRFTEENFATLIAFIFIYKVIESNNESKFLVYTLKGLERLGDLSKSVRPRSSSR